MNDGIGSDDDVGADVGGGRIYQCDACRHQLVILARVQNRRHVGQLLPAVHAQNLVGVIDGDGFNRQASRSIDPHQVGQVVLVLRVGGTNRTQGGKQRREIERVDATVDLRNRALLGRGIFVLDNGNDTPIFTNDPSITVRVLHEGGEHRGGGGALLVSPDESLQCLATKQRNVAR